MTIAIVGVRTDAQLADNLAATQIDLKPPNWTGSTRPAASRSASGATSAARPSPYGNTFDLIDDHRKTIDALV